jgi:hypothetical protein
VEYKNGGVKYWSQDIAIKPKQIIAFSFPLSHKLFCKIIESPFCSAALAKKNVLFA